MFVLGLAMQGKLYTSAQDILDMLGVAGDLGSGLLYFLSRAAGLGGTRCRPPSPTTAPSSSSSPAYSTSSPPLTRTTCARGGSLVIHPSHFTAVLLFSLFASTVFGITMRDTPRKMFRYGAYCFVLFVGSVIVFSWVMFLIAR